MIYRPALNAAFIFAIIGVVTGAMGAHALKDVLTPEMKNAYETAVKYQFYHSFALGFAAFINMVFPSPWVKRAAWAFISGIILFSGSIYLLVYMETTATIGLSKLGILTPIGGLCFIAGWIFLLIGINAGKKNRIEHKQ